MSQSELDKMFIFNLLQNLSRPLADLKIVVPILSPKT